MESFYRIVRLISLNGARVASAFLIAMVILVLVDIIRRTCFGTSFIIVGEYAGYLLLGLSFMAFAYTLSIGKHISITLVTSRLHGRVKKYISLFVSVLALAFCAYFGFQIFEMTKVSYQSMTVSQSVIRTPLFIPQLVICIGMGLLTFQFFILTCQEVYTGRKHGKL